MDADPEIVRELLEAGANPTSDEVGYDSALIIASKNSSPLLPLLTKYTSKASLNCMDVEGILFHSSCYFIKLKNKLIIILTNIKILS